MLFKVEYAIVMAVGMILCAGVMGGEKTLTTKRERDEVAMKKLPLRS